MTEPNGVLATHTPNETLTQAEDELRSKHREVSSEETPQHHVKRRPDGFDYVEEGYMRNLLNERYPIWSWKVERYEFVGDQYVIVHGRLEVVDNSVPRCYDSIAGHRIHKKRDSNEYSDIGNSTKAANSDAFKVAVNRLCNIADDVYRKSYNVSDEQKTALLSGASTVDDPEVLKTVEQGLEDGKINATNFRTTLKWIEHSKAQEVT
jgi:hypothetical protein